LVAEIPEGAAAPGRRDDVLPLVCGFVSIGALVVGGATSLTIVVCGRFRTDRISPDSGRSTIGASSVTSGCVAMGRATGGAAIVAEGARRSLAEGAAGSAKVAIGAAASVAGASVFDAAGKAEGSSGGWKGAGSSGAGAKAGTSPDVAGGAANSLTICSPPHAARAAARRPPANRYSGSTIGIG
jgi:hypothetical protein